MRFGPSAAALAALALAGAADGSALADRIYTSLTPNGVSKLLNADGWIGASSLERGSVGYLYRINKASDVDDFAGANGPFYNDEGYIVLLAQSMLADKASMKRLLYMSQLRGVLLYDDGTRAAYSAGNVRPGFGIRTANASTPTWNPVGGGYGTDELFGIHWTGLIQGPVFLLSPADAALVNARYDASRNIGDPGKVQPNALGARLEFFQWAAGNAKMCLRRHAGGDVGSAFCLPLGGWSSAGSFDPTNHAKEAIVVAAPMDAVSLFHDNSYGANEGAGALAALVALARMLTFGLTAAQRAAATKQVYFVAFQGESFENIGSTAFFNALTGGNFPSSDASVTPSNVKQWIEFGELGTASAVNLHAVNPSFTALQNNVFNNATHGTWTPAAANKINAASSASTPPSSFRKLVSLPDRNSVSNPFGNADALLLSDTTSSAFTNQYYQTRLDNATNLGITNTTDGTSDSNIQTLCGVVRAVADTLAAEIGVSAPGAGGRSVPDNGIDADCQVMVQNVLQALLINSSKTVPSHNTSGVEYAVGIKGTGEPMNRYVSVYSGGSQYAQLAEAFMQYQLAGALSLSQPELSPDNCPSTASASGYHTVRTANDGDTQFCFNTSSFWLHALSPAFSGSGADWSITDDSGTYSTWTESTWDEAGLDIFLMQDPSEGIAVVAGGAVYAVFVAVMTWAANRWVSVGASAGPPVMNPSI